MLSNILGYFFVIHVSFEQKAFHKLSNDVVAVGTASAVPAEQELCLVLIATYDGFSCTQYVVLARNQIRVSLK